MATIQRPSSGGSAFRSEALGPLWGASRGWEGLARAVPAAEPQRLSKYKVPTNAQGGHRTRKSPTCPMPTEVGKLGRRETPSDTRGQ